MKVIGLEIFPLSIPFVCAFSHATKHRTSSDSIVIRLHGEGGVTGHGEAVVRPYVTGETIASSIYYMQSVLWPAVRDYCYPRLEPESDPIVTFAPVSRSLPQSTGGDSVVWHGARAAFEIALIDLLLKQQSLSLSDVLRPSRTIVTYSGVIGLGKDRFTRDALGRYLTLGIKHYKCKVARRNVETQIKHVRRSIGNRVSLRIDANGDFDMRCAKSELKGLERHDIICIEQPIPRSDEFDLARVQHDLHTPVMADESLITAEDARRLIAARACQWFNLRIAKCGGIVNTLHLARIAAQAGIRVQLGCQVGETAILSAVGRHVAAHLAEVKFVEGSFGTALLEQDVTARSVMFGAGGAAPLIQGLGIGVEVCESILQKYTTHTLSLGEH